MTHSMCHHLVDVDEPYRADEYEREEAEDEQSVEPDEPAVGVKLDREYEESDVKTPSDD